MRCMPRRTPPPASLVLAFLHILSRAPPATVGRELAQALEFWPLLLCTVLPRLHALPPRQRRRARAWVQQRLDEAAGRGEEATDIYELIGRH